MLGGEGVEAAAVEGAGLDVGQRFAFEGVVAIDFQVADAVARDADGDDLAAPVIERARYRDDARPDLEKRANWLAGAKEHLALLPAADAAEAEHHLKTGVVERLAQVERPANTAVARHAICYLRPRRHGVLALAGYRCVEVHVAHQHFSPHASPARSIIRAA